MNGVGSYTATCSGGTLAPANGDPVPLGPVSVTYTVKYGPNSGVLQPINPNNSSVFNRKSTVPVKFTPDGESRDDGVRHDGLDDQGGSGQLHVVRFNVRGARGRPIEHAEHGVPVGRLGQAIHLQRHDLQPLRGDLLDVPDQPR